MYATALEVHPGEKELQDRAACFWCGSSLVLVVADGAGGMSGGAEAAQFFVDGIKRQFDPSNTSPSKLVDLLKFQDQAMASVGAYGETTGVIAVLTGNSILGASVGDSGAFIFSKTGMRNLTTNQIRKPFIGSGRAIPVPFACDALSGTLLLATDGLLKYTSLEKISEAILATDLNIAAKKLVDLVRYQSGAFPDDVSLLLARPL